MQRCIAAESEAGAELLDHAVMPLKSSEHRMVGIKVPVRYGTEGATAGTNLMIDGML